MRHLRSTILVALASGPLLAQCGTQWLPGGGSPGTNGNIAASTRWDPDGPGPSGDLLVVAGSFEIVASVAARSIAVFDAASGSWSSLGTGMNGPVQAVLALPNGDLLAAGQFTSAGGTSVAGVARWSGTSWSPVGAGLPIGYNQFGVTALARLPNGDIIAGGSFYPVGGPMAIARWDGAAWSPLGGGVTGYGGSSVRALCVRSNGDLVAGGEFTTIGGVTVANLATWNGAVWSPLGAGVDGQVHALCELPNGTLAAGGFFHNAGGAPAERVAIWNGSVWSPLGSGVTAPNWGVSALASMGNDLIVGGNFTAAGGIAMNHVARWDGTWWSPLGSGISSDGGVFALTTMPTGDLVVGGNFATAGSSHAAGLARWNGTTWSAFATGTDGYFQDLAPLPNGDLVVGGWFSTVDGTPCANVARRTGGTWHALGSGTNGPVSAVVAMPNGDVVAGGQFTAAGGVAANHVARWDGATWSPLGPGVGGSFQPEVMSLAVAPNGDLLAGGSFTTAGGAAAARVARWNGTAWSPLGAGLANGASIYVTVDALAFLPNGDLVAGGDFTSSGSTPVARVARWNGAAWVSLGTGITVPLGTTSARVRQLLAMPNGELIAAGHGNSFGVGFVVLRRWNGSSWSPMETGLTPGSSPIATGLASLPNGDIVASLIRVGLSGGPVTSSLARWDGSAWSSLGTSLNNGIVDVVVQPDGTLAAVGAFAAIDSVVAVNFGQLVSTCPATIAAAGAGCSGSGGPNVLSAGLAWVGGTFRSLASGLPPNGLAASVYGFTTLALPMPTVHPLGQAGCTLWVDDNILLDFPRGNGTVASQLAVPAQAALVGGVFYHQVVAVEIDAGGNLQGLTSTNALRLTIGAF